MCHVFLVLSLPRQLQYAIIQTLGCLLQLGCVGLAEITVLETDVEHIGKCIEIVAHLFFRKVFFLIKMKF